jgi:hypothetical protein
MKKALVALVVATLLILSASVAWAIFKFITINDLTDNIVVTTSNGDTDYLIINQPSILGEKVTITGTWDVSGSGNTLIAVSNYALFRAPANNSGENDVNDTAKWPDATTGPVDHISNFAVVYIGGSDGVQNIGIPFESDGGTNFQSDLLTYVPSTAYPSHYTDIIENGLIQDLSTLTPRVGSDGRVITLKAASDISAVPLPPSVILLGSGLLGLVGLRRFMKS